MMIEVLFETKKVTLVIILEVAITILPKTKNPKNRKKYK